jgi:hypothetical protein
MSDGRTSSLDYLHAGFAGSVVADTSRPTGEGNYHVLRGMLRAFDIPVGDATVGLIGAGNIGLYVAERIMGEGGRVLALEPRAERRALLRGRGIQALPPEEKGTLLREPMDALVLNAAGGSLETATVRAAAANATLRVICGSENLVMPVPEDAALFLAARKAYSPTEYGGMMGYLTAVEQYLAELEGVPFDPATMITAAAQLEQPTWAATRRVIEQEFAVGFEEAVEALAKPAA